MVDATGDRNFAHLLGDAASRWPHAIAIEEGGRSFSYSHIRARAGQFASGLRAIGIKPGDRVAILLPRGAECAAAIFAVFAVGGIVVILNEELKALQLQHCVRTAAVQAIISSDEILGNARRQVLVGVRELLIDAPLATSDLAPIPRAGQDRAQITFTSGSTGQPKGVLASHSNLWAGLRCVQSYLQVRPDDRVASLLSFAFVYGFSQLTLSVAVGATLLVERSALAPRLIEALRARRATVIAAVPPLWQQLISVSIFRDQEWPGLRVLTNAGGHLAPSVVRELRRAQPGAKLFLMYGLTEVFRSTYLPPEEVDAHPDSMGRAIPESRVVIVREDGTECEVGETGEVVHAGPTVAVGYWNDEDATERVFRPDPLSQLPKGRRPRVVYTGDLARRDADGRLYHVGRSDSIIKTLGFRVSPDEISDLIVGTGQVSECAVHGIPDEARGQAIVAHVVLRSEGSLVEVRSAIGRELPRHLHPQRIIEHVALPRTPNGKLDLQALKTSVRP